MTAESQISEDIREIDDLRLRLAAAEQFIKTLDLEPKVKLTGKRRDAYQAWIDIRDEQRQAWSDERGNRP